MTKPMGDLAVTPETVQRWREAGLIHTKKGVAIPMGAEQMMVEGFLNDPVRVRVRVGDSYFVVDSETSATALLIRDLGGGVIAAIHGGSHRTDLEDRDG